MCRAIPHNTKRSDSICPPLSSNGFCQFTVSSAFNRTLAAGKQRRVSGQRRQVSPSRSVPSRSLVRSCFGCIPTPYYLQITPFHTVRLQPQQKRDVTSVAIQRSQRYYRNNMVVLLENKTKGVKTSGERTFPKVLILPYNAANPLNLMSARTFVALHSRNKNSRLPGRNPVQGQIADKYFFKKACVYLQAFVTEKLLEESRWSTW